MEKVQHVPAAVASGDSSNDQAPVAEDGLPAVGSDLGSALLLGALSLAKGAPEPPEIHPDPMIEFYKSLCADLIPELGAAASVARTQCLTSRRPCAARRSPSQSPTPRRRQDLMR